MTTDQIEEAQRLASKCDAGRTDPRTSYDRRMAFPDPQTLGWVSLRLPLGPARMA